MRFATRQLFSAINTPTKSAFTADLRIGRIIQAWPHPDSTKLYIQRVEIGLAQPRLILSGLAPFIPLPTMKGLVLVVANLAPRKLAGQISEGMLLCARLGEGTLELVELLRPGDEEVVGSRLLVERSDDQTAQQDDGIPSLLKGKAWQKFAKGLATDEQGRVCWQGKRLISGDKGNGIVCSLKNAQIS